LRRDLRFRRSVGRLKGGEGIAFGERRPHSRDLELRRNEVALEVAQFGAADRRVELDQYFAGLDGLPIPDSAHP
jgi:hypothetical protein